MNVRNVTTIPDWTPAGVLPPINVCNPAKADRAPYRVSLNDFVTHFGINRQRLTIISGFLEFRRLLHSNGINSGFQWVDGSFLENVEMLENRAPNDIDVVTFFRIPSGLTEQTLANRYPDIFLNRPHLKNTFHVDHYFINLEWAPERLVERASYWYSMWAHRRNHTWKGFIEIGLASDTDAIAGTMVTALFGGFR